MLSGWRLVHEDWIDAAFSGDGARRYGGRWNSKGYRAIYMADSLALATLEIMVHAVTYADLQYYLFVQAQFTHDLIEEVPAGSLPDNWHEDPPPLSTRQFGDRWIEAKTSPVLKIPNVVIPVGFNYIINPEHPDFHKIKIGQVQPFVLDGRLIKH
jgi:RES domain-containing protein